MIIDERAQVSSRPGLREDGKRRKLERLARAGRALFIQKGFDDTTTRAIAAKAGVGAGTFFLYFTEKRDLLFHLFRDEVSAVQAEGFASLPTRARLVAQLTHVLGRLYAYYGRDPRLSRAFMKELLFLEPGERDDLLAMTMGFVRQLADLVAQAKARGEIAPSVDPMDVATHAFALHCFGLIAWLNGALRSPDDVRADVESKLKQLVRGLAPRGARPSRGR